MDDRLIRREIYNPSKHRVTFTRMDFNLEVGPIYAYCVLNHITPGPKKIICEPDSFCILNHAFYICQWNTSFKGEVIDFISKFGKDIGNGSKLPSRPEEKKNFF